MRGTKRFAASDLNPLPNDSILSKRILAGSSLDTQRAEPSQRQIMTASPPLDMQRAESSRQHVRALNKQFASWIQTQLEKHPDELWEDGVQDYLNHAKTIMEKFDDVVSWLKANAAKNENNSITGLDTIQKKPVSESKEQANNFLFGKPGIPPASTTASFGTSWGSGPVFNSSSPFSFGIQGSVGNKYSVSMNNDASNDTVEEEDVEQPSSPSVKKTEEEGIIVVHEVNCKVYVKSSDPTDKDAWKDKGSGQLSIKCKEGVDKGTRESKPIIVVRNEVGKVLLNASLYTGIKTNLQRRSIIAIFHTLADGDNKETVVAQTFLIRTKTDEERDQLAEVIKEYAPAA
ncbi:unnamed protein product [Coffea canephora]|uniref:RanBD1 domain-containing protein n=2 Tax=Coffea TaxID=13442 RepID=A0A068UMZ9_COFCA|nr:uncharacterized protein LOC113707306 isoform X1 [Coffea arabica]CDP09816.1 unnamed protein product [Coffea canephora]